MKTLINKITLALAAIFLATQLTATDLEIRFEKSEYDADSKELVVNVQVRNIAASAINLAGQNYRFYYDSEVLTLDTEQSFSALSSKSYSEISFDKHLKGIEADKVNQVSFDDNLGFVNFSINLKSNSNGGVILEQDEWNTVAQLSFTVEQEATNYDLVWGRNGATDLYATAFVNIAKWIAPGRTDHAEIAFYGDLTSQDEAAKEIAFDATVGPNPTIDYVNITLAESLDADAQVYVKDMTGKLMSAQSIAEGDMTTRVDLSSAPAATYLVYITDNTGSLLHQTRVVVAK